MNSEAAEFLAAEEVDVDPFAIYLLIGSDSGLLLEDAAPLLGAVERAYRRLFTLSLDDETRDLLLTRQRRNQRLHGVSRSINARYEQLVIPRQQEDRLSTAEKRTNLRESKRQIVGFHEIKFGRIWESPRAYTPHRVEISKARMSSPGFIELLGDPEAFTLLATFIGWLIRERRLERHHQDAQLLATRGDQRDTIRLLREMGYTREEIEAIGSFISADLGTILQELERSRARLAPGDEVDPTDRLRPPPDE